MLVIISHWTHIIEYTTADLHKDLERIAGYGPEKTGPVEFELMVEARWKLFAYTVYRDGIVKALANDETLGVKQIRTMVMQDILNAATNERMNTAYKAALVQIARDLESPHLLRLEVVTE